MENLTTIKNNSFLKQSELYAEVYEKSQMNETQTFNEVSIYDIDDWYNSILNKYNFLNVPQIENLQSFFTSFKYVLSTIDPNKLNIKNKIIEEKDLILWNESANGISKLIFDEYGQIVYLFNGNDGSKQKGVFNSKVDMEKLLYRFISK